MAQKTLTIHTENILPIIKKWLYSDKDIFIRELVSNACDAIHKCKVLREHGELQALDSEFRIDISLNKEERTLTFADTGIGMTAEEVEKYIAQVAFSGAEEFIGKYKSQDEQEHIIGHFGLGFYSAYMVAEKVTINTLSYKPDAEAVFWSCDGSATYELELGTGTSRGTEITLHIDKESDEFLDESKIRTILRQYCAFLPVPIFLNGSQINEKDPLWIKPPSECTDKDYLDFYHTLYPMEPDPIFWVHLNVDYPFHLKGILYFPKITSRFEWNKCSTKLFCNRVFVSDNCKDLIPDYLMVLRGAIDSPDIPLNVSRSYLQMDRTVRQLSTHLSKKISDRLSSLYTNEKESFLNAWPDIEMIVKLGMLQDDKFYERSKDFLVWKTLSDEWTTAEEYLTRRKESYKGKIFYTSDDKHTPHFLDLYKEKEIEVLKATSPVDTPLMNLLEGKLEGVHFQRIDGALDEAILDTAREKTLLDADGKTESVKIADFIRSTLSIDNTEVDAKSLSSDHIPAFLVVDEDSRRMRETFALTQQSIPDFLKTKLTFVVNTNSRLVQSIYGLKDKDPALAKEMVQHLYELSLLSQKELNPNALAQFISRSNRVLEQLACGSSA